MTVKKMIIISIAWTVFMLIVAFVIGFVFIGADASNGAARGRMLGQGIGVVVSIGYAALWLPWAAKIGKQKREEKERQARRGRKRRRPNR